MIAHPLQILGHEHQMGAHRDAARVFHHIGQKLAEDAGIHLVHLFIAFPNPPGLFRVALGIGVEDVLEHLLYLAAHAWHGLDKIDFGKLGKGDGALGHVGGVIGDTFDIAGNLQRGDDIAQVHRHGLAQRQQAHGKVGNLVFQFVHFVVGFHYLLGHGAVAFEDGLDGSVEL